MRKYLTFRLGVQIKLDLSECLLALAILLHAIG
jgi:hypothetical protein